MNSSEDKQDLYMFNAPSFKTNVPPRDETGAIVGALTACIIISAVLLFLWKMLQKKKAEMETIQKDAEKALETEKVLAESSDNSIAKEKRIKKVSSRTSSKWEKIHLPNSTITEDVGFDSVDLESQEVEMILPPLSPIPSSTWSQQDEMISSDTGYNSGFGRKNGTLRRRYKQYTDELYTEHPKDIVEALKRNRQLIRKHRQNRSTKVAEAIKSLNECQKLIQSTTERIGNYSRSKLEKLKKLRKNKKKRIHSEVKRKYDAEQQRYFDEKEAFVAMQEWFDGLHLHISTREIAEEIFLLRSFHRTAIERNAYEKQTVRECQICIRNCVQDVENARKDLRLWKRAFKEKEPLNKDTEENFDQSTKIEKLECEVSDISSRHRIMFPRVIKRTTVRSSLVDEKISENIQNSRSNGNTCSRCNQASCQCFPKSKEKVLISTQTCSADPFLHTVTNKCSSKQLSSTAMSDFANDFEVTASNETPTTSKYCRSSANTHLLTLKLRQILIPDALSTSEQFTSISEREVQKVLQKVPTITALKSLKKDGHKWIVEVESTSSRVANIRFNFKKKSYVIGMLS